MMQKQRSPYTGGGGFNLQQLKATTFSKTETINGMPFLMQLAQQVQVQRPIGCQHVPNTQPLRAGAGAGGGSGTSPRPFLSNINNNNNNTNGNSPNYNGNYEGEIFPLSMSKSNSSPAVENDFLHKAHTHNHGQGCGHVPGQVYGQRTVQGYGQGHGLGRGLGNGLGLGQTMGQGDGYERGQSVDQFEHLDQLMPMGQLVTSKKAHHSDTDSESEYCQHMKMNTIENSRWGQVFEYLKSRMPVQRQKRMDAALQRCYKNSFLSHVLLLLQLLGILVGGSLLQGLRIGVNLTRLSLRLWQCKFQLRSLMRQLLWRMANAKGNDLLLFLAVLLLSPWLFLISLFGFAISSLLHLKDGLAVALRQLHLYVLN